MPTLDEQVAASMERQKLESAERAIKSAADSKIIPFPAKDYPAGLVGEVAEYCLQCAPVPNTSFALIAGLIVVAMLSRNRYVVEPLDTTLNLYCIEVGDSACGKENAPKVTKNILNELGLGDRITDGVASDVALLRALSEAPDHSMFYWQDETWKILYAAAGKQASTHAQGIYQVIMSLYSMADMPFHGRKYANPKDNIEAIPRPFLVFGGATTPSRFADALEEKHVADGFLNRLLVFQSDVTGNKSRVRPPPLPADLKQRLTDLFDPRYTSACAMPEELHRNVITWAEGAYEIATAFDEYCTSEIKADPVLGGLWSRGFENAIKVSGLLAVGINHENPIISVEQIRWAVRLITHCQTAFVKILDSQLASNEFDALCKKALGIIGNAIKYREDKQFGHMVSYGCPRGLLTKKLRVKSHTVSDVVRFLLDSQQIEELEIEGSNIYTIK
jgi:hypothetical protein